MDALLCPAAPGVAGRHGEAKYWCYTSQWNLLDYPAAVFPVTKVDKNIDRIDPKSKHEPMSELDAENWALCGFAPLVYRFHLNANRGRDIDDPALFHGLPVSLQLVARRFEDEKLLAILEYIKAETGLPFTKFP